MSDHSSSDTVPRSDPADRWMLEGLREEDVSSEDATWGESDYEDGPETCGQVAEGPQNPKTERELETAVDAQNFEAVLPALEGRRNSSTGATAHTGSQTDRSAAFLSNLEDNWRERVKTAVAVRQREPVPRPIPDGAPCMQLMRDGIVQTRSEPGDLEPDRGYPGHGYPRPDLEESEQCAKAADFVKTLLEPLQQQPKNPWPELPLDWAEPGSAWASGVTVLMCRLDHPGQEQNPGGASGQRDDPQAPERNEDGTEGQNAGDAQQQQQQQEESDSTDADFHDEMHEAVEDPVEMWRSTMLTSGPMLDPNETWRTAAAANDLPLLASPQAPAEPTLPPIERYPTIRRESSSDGRYSVVDVDEAMARSATAPAAAEGYCQCPAETGADKDKKKKFSKLQKKKSKSKQPTNNDQISATGSNCPLKQDGDGGGGAAGKPSSGWRNYLKCDFRAAFCPRCGGRMPSRFATLVSRFRGIDARRQQQQDSGQTTAGPSGIPVEAGPPMTRRGRVSAPVPTANLLAPGPSSAGASEMFSTQAPGPSNTQAPEPSDLQAPALSSTQVSGFHVQMLGSSTTQVSVLSSTQAPGPSNTQAPELSNLLASEIFSTQAPPESSNTQAPEPSSTQAPEPSNSQAQEMSDTGVDDREEAARR
ncbi:hypothetical protein GGR56DRAFT_670173 [Xylariaceae sp. FL0804]|nr:hypothetical protein GGR56DRAFT_670173 [Xylariaceae sp. FL0804]